MSGKYSEKEDHASSLTSASSIFKPDPELLPPKMSLSSAIREWFHSHKAKKSPKVNLNGLFRDRERKAFLWENWTHLETEGYTVEEVVCTRACTLCDNKMTLVRTTTGWKGGEWKDVLRWEHEVEGGKGRVVIEFANKFNKEFSQMRKEYKEIGREKGKQLPAVKEGKEFVVVMEKLLEKMKCVKCNTIIEMQHEVRRYGDEQVLRWYLKCKQGDKFLKGVTVR